jgi:hypothetical protein
VAFPRLTNRFNATTRSVIAFVEAFEDNFSFGAPTFDQCVRPS